MEQDYGETMYPRHDRPSGSDAWASTPPTQARGDQAGCATADPLSDVLETVRLRGAVFFVWEPFWPFATEVPSGSSFGPFILPGAGQIISYHIVTRGPCWAAVAAEEPLRLDTGDILLVPHGDAYVMSSEPTRLPSTLDPAALEFFRRMGAGDLPPLVVDGGPGPESNRVVCGFLGCDRLPHNPVFEAVPRLVRIPAAVGVAGDTLTGLVDFAVAESHSRQVGARCVTLRLSEVLFVEVLRRYLTATPSEQTGWLAGLRDPMTARTLRLMHQRPAAAWTLETLARESGTSRSILAARFGEIVGQPPMEYLARWRMHLAARRLADGATKIHAVAREVGYDSEAAFSRAFKRLVGMSPSYWRAGTRGAVPEARPDTVRDTVMNGPAGGEWDS